MHLEAPQKFLAIHARHHEIGDNHVRIEAGELLESLLAVGRGLHRVAPQRDHSGQRGTLRFFVVHYQDAGDGTLCFHLVLL